MTKKSVTTFHPLAVAKSLEAQNHAVGLVFMAAQTAMDLAASVDDTATLRRLIGDVYAKAEAARAILWPGDAGESP